MNTISVAQAIDVMHDLYLALAGKNGFGSDTAEIYGYRLMPRNPSYGQKNCGLESLGMECEAGQALGWLCEEFCERNNCEIEIDNMPLSTWLLRSGRIQHRVHVRVIPNDG